MSNGGNADAEIQGATGSTYSLAGDDEGKTLKVRVSFTDDAGHDESLTSAPTDTVTGPPPAPTPGNTPATGLPVIRAKPQVGWTLWAYTSGIADADGLSDPTFTYQWLSNDGDTDTVITGATNLNYVIGAAAEGKTLKVRVSFTDDAGYNERLTSAPTDTVTLVTPQVIGICDRTPQVRDAILPRLPKDRTCQLVTDADLISITHQLDLVNQRVTSLKAGDFEGLFNVSVLNLENNDLTTLPAGVFDGLTGVYILYLENNHLETLPAGVFEGLSSLLTVRLSSNGLETLPSGVFDGLISLRILDVRDNELNELPPDLFDGLAGLSELLLDGNELGGLPPEIFGGLAGLELLRLDSNSLSALPGNVFYGLSDLKKLDLQINDPASLPEGLFAGLTGLKELRLDTNNGAPFTLTAELEQRGEDAIVVKVAQGAPFAMRVVLSATAGVVSETEVTIDAGSVESGPITVTRTDEAQVGVVVRVVSAAFVGPAKHPGVQTGLGDSLKVLFEIPVATISFSPSGSVSEGTEITVTMSLSKLEADSDTSTKDYIFRADVKDSNGGNVDRCEDQANGYGLGVDRYMWKVDEDPETRTGIISADCPAGDYTLRASISTPDNVELASACTNFTVVDPGSPLSNDATLSGVDFGMFTSTTTAYTASVGNDVTETTVTPTVNDGGATYAVKHDGVADADGTVSLAVGSNVITVEVTAEDGQTAKTYTVTVTRAAPPLSNDAMLSGLSLSGVDIGAFDPETADYAANVANAVDETTVTPTVNDGGATYAVKLDGVADADGTVSLAVGSSVITVEVTAEDGETTQTYSVTVTRAEPPSTDATLNGLTLSGVDIGTFYPATTQYTADVDNAVTETTVTPTLNDDGATYVIKLDGTADKDRSIALAVGSNVITVEVTAEDGPSRPTPSP